MQVVTALCCIATSLQFNVSENDFISFSLNAFFLKCNIFWTVLAKTTCLSIKIALSEDFILKSIIQICSHFFYSLDLAILCCNVSEASLHAVMEILQDIVPKLNLLPAPPVENLSPDKIKDYLKEVRLKACVLVVDGKTVNDAYKNLPRQKEEYRGLLETAANRVGK